MFSDFVRFLKRSWGRHFATQLSILVVMIVCYATVVTFLLGLSNLRTVASLWGNEITVTAYLKQKISQGEVDSLLNAIKDEPRIAKVDFQSQTEAQKSFTEQMLTISPDLASDPDVLGIVPASLRLKLNQDMLKSYGLPMVKNLADTIAQLAGVEEVTFGQAWVEKYKKLLHGMDILIAIIGLILLAACMLTLVYSIRVSIYQRRAEIEILELIGSTRMRIRTPFILTGLFYGFLASVLAVTAVYLMVNGILIVLEASVGGNLPPDVVQLFSFSELIAIVLVGSFLSGFTTFLSVLKINTGWSASRKSV